MLMQVELDTPDTLFTAMPSIVREDVVPRAAHQFGFRMSREQIRGISAFRGPESCKHPKVPLLEQVKGRKH